MPFYVMQAIDGWSPMDGGWAAPFDDDLTARRGLAFELVEGAAKLGRVDWRAQGLDGFGRPDGFHERQVDRWLAFLDSYKVRDLPGIDDAAGWLRRHRPAITGPASCTATTSSPTSCSRTVNRPGSPRSSTGR